MDHREDGNFDYFIQRKNSFDTVLRSHLDTSPRNARYLSLHIQNELSSRLGDEIRYSIVKLIDKSKFLQCNGYMRQRMSQRKHNFLSV